MNDIRVGDVVRFATDVEHMIVVQVTATSICTIDEQGRVDTWKRTAALCKCGNRNVADTLKALLDTIRK